jgi:hypothetical protein
LVVPLPLTTALASMSILSARSNGPSELARRSLRARGFLVRLEATLLALIVLGVFLLLSTAPAASNESQLQSVLFGALAIGLFAEFALGIYLLHAPCPHCNNRFAARSVANLFIAPPPAIFAVHCSSCGTACFGDAR